MKQNTKILFMGTPLFAATALKGLIEAGFDIVSVITRPDTSKGRSSSKTPSEVKLLAIEHNLRVFQPESKLELKKVVEEIRPDLIVVAAYGMIIPKKILDIPKYGALNIHGSILPKYRGASPITESILNGDEETGITIMQMSEGMDEGEIIQKTKVKIHNKDTTESLTARLADLGAKATVETIPGWISGDIQSTPQNDAEATYCRKISKEDGHIDWNLPAEKIERMVRAYTPWPTAFTFIDGKRLKILKASSLEPPASSTTPGELEFNSGHLYVGTGKGTLEILELQPEGRKPMTAADFINGNAGLDGSKLE